MFLHRFAALLACTVVLGLASLSSADQHNDHIKFQNWYKWLETCRPDSFAVIQPQMDALVKAIPPDLDSDPSKGQYTKEYLQRSGIFELVKGTPEWDDIKIRSAGWDWNYFVSRETKQCARDNQEKQKRLDEQKRETVKRHERIRREMAAQAERERKAAKKVAACTEHAQYKASLKEGPGVEVPRFTMLDIEQWENWMRQNYPIRFAKYTERMMAFVDCEVQAYEAEGREMDSILGLMKDAGVFALIVRTKEWSHYVDWIAAQQR